MLIETFNGNCLLKCTIPNTYTVFNSVPYRESEPEHRKNFSTSTVTKGVYFTFGTFEGQKLKPSIILPSRMVALFLKNSRSGFFLRTIELYIALCHRFF